MKRLLLCGSLGALSLCLGDLRAQTGEPPPLPPGPLLQKMADYSAMKITYSYPQEQEKAIATDKSPPGPTLFSLTPIRQLTLTRTKPIWHAVRVDVYGNNLGQWYDGHNSYCEVVGISEPAVNNPAQGQTYSAGMPDLNQTDFPDMGWISPQTYTGVETMVGHKCLVFKKNDMTAWIDLESRLPVQWQRGKETRTFQQLPPPTALLALPPKIAAFAAIIYRNDHKWDKFRPAAGR